MEYDVVTQVVMPTSKTVYKFKALPVITICLATQELGKLVTGCSAIFFWPGLKTDVAIVGHQHELTIMYAATCHPTALVQGENGGKSTGYMFLHICLVKRIKTDQGSNFMSWVFAQVIPEAAIKDKVSSAYHP